MPRPRKFRRVCHVPLINLYGPLIKGLTDHEPVIMSVEEYETIRLIDLDGLTQEECALRMDVARTTVQKIYSDARTKIAKSLVNGDVLRIEGGDYKVYDDSDSRPRCGNRRLHAGHGFNNGKE
jgi:uncharacterized protein